MKSKLCILVCILMGLLISSCGAIPTLPPLDATVSVPTAQFTIASELTTEQGQVDHQGTAESPSGTPSEPLGTVNIQPQPTATRFQAQETDPVTETLTPTAFATLAATPTAITFPYQTQVNNPHYLSNFARPDLGCGWLGIGGQVFNSEDVVQKDVIIKVGGELAGSPIVEEMTMPLAEPEIDSAYGPGGYELTLAEAPVDSDSTVWIQLFSLQGVPLTERISIITYDDCQKNLLLINFVEE